MLEKDEINREEKVTGHRSYTEFKEADLHPLLVAFLDANENFRLHCKTIIHNKCVKRAKGETEWNHPDIVGVHFPFDDDLCKDTLAFLKNSNLLDYKIYSFEIKKSISFADVKEYYFQAVSNSSFAHFGYLVVYVNIDDDVLKELRRLNNLFGIGVIQLESNVFDSTILLPARENKLDIATLDMLTTSCPCFKEFIQDINDYIKAKAQNLHAKTHFDKVLSEEEILQHITDKKMAK
ncbi:hypothetical protein [Helicobacter saguini]|uniref:hypothetical protein n=1 Tax=Helicobacter saguini TaxID=1548018 RepID=UPI000691C4AA|nr:hypothetical protein [Helicobacter saguini]